MFDNSPTTPPISTQKWDLKQNQFPFVIIVFFTRRLFEWPEQKNSSGASGSSSSFAGSPSTSSTCSVILFLFSLTGAIRKILTYHPSWHLRSLEKTLETELFYLAFTFCHCSAMVCPGDYDRFIFPGVSSKFWRLVGWVQSPIWVLRLARIISGKLLVQGRIAIWAMPIWIL